jgi:hypothetical protein
MNTYEAPDNTSEIALLAVARSTVSVRSELASPAVANQGKHREEASHARYLPT